MKKWIHERVKNAGIISDKLGISLGNLVNCSLLIHVSYAGKAEGGRSVLVKVERVEIREDHLYFDFQYSRIKIGFDAMPGRQLGGAFKGFGCNTEIEIEGLSFDGTDWTGIFWVGDMQDELYEQNLDVQIINPIQSTTKGKV
jgi:hypothetical protein